MSPGIIRPSNVVLHVGVILTAARVSCAPYDRFRANLWKEKKGKPPEID